MDTVASAPLSASLAVSLPIAYGFQICAYPGSLTEPGTVAGSGALNVPSHEFVAIDSPLNGRVTAFPFSLTTVTLPVPFSRFAPVAEAISNHTDQVA